MLGLPDPERPARISNYWIVSLSAFAVVLAYLGWVFWSRAHEARVIEERAAQQRRAQDERTFEGMGGDRFDILGFYASPAVIGAGDSTDLCYSVSNAKSVTLEPQSNPVWPAFSHCVSVSPRKATTYTLTATDAAGHTKSATATVEVR